MEQELTKMGIKTAAELREVSKDSLTNKFGERTGTFLYLACRGVVSTSSRMLLCPVVRTDNNLWAQMLRGMLLAQHILHFTLHMVLV